MPNLELHHQLVVEINEPDYLCVAVVSHFLGGVCLDPHRRRINPVVHSVRLFLVKAFSRSEFLVKLFSTLERSVSIARTGLDAMI